MRLLLHKGARASTGLHRSLAALSLALLLAPLTDQAKGQLGPAITSIGFDSNGDLEVFASIPPGYRHGVLEVIPGGADFHPALWQTLVSGPLTGASGDVRFVLPRQGTNAFLRAGFGTDTLVPPAPFSGLEHFSPAYSDGGFYFAESAKTVHVLNRLGYGPGPLDYNKLVAMGSTAYINEQLAPATIDESGNTDLNDRVADLFHTYLPYGGKTLLAAGSACKFFRGTVEPTPGTLSEPTTDWAQPGFIDTAWEDGNTGVGYGDGDDATVLADMRQDLTTVPVTPGYLTVYLRQSFEVPDLGAIDTLLLRVRYDDAFVAYLNGVRVAGYNVTGAPPAFNTPADTGGGNVDSATGAPYEFDITDFVNTNNLLVQGTNVLAVQMHNTSVTSSDSSINPSLVNVSPSPFPAIKGVRELQHLIHLRGIYSEKQLQAVLGEFWENHFTTDYDKVDDTLEDWDAYQDLIDAGVDEGLVRQQVRTEAASLEYDEYQFFYDNALGDFGDMLLYSATAPTMLMYLDSILNTKNAPNENYPREILELHTKGVDNGYTQTDIEVLSKCFTGWTIRKVHPADKLPFPQSARTPFITPSQVVDSETAIVDSAVLWQYFKGTVEPTPGPGGEATTDWAQPAFVPTGWDTGASGIGYGDSDDNTILNDMQFIPDPVDPVNNPPVQAGYASFYARHEFTMPAGTFDAVVFSIDYDDGYVAYLNGVEIARSGTMSAAPTPPPFDYLGGSREAGNPAIIDLAPHAHLLLDAPTVNVLAVQVHNTSLNSSDTSMIPRILGRTYTPDSISESDPNGLWTFRFNPDEHDLSEKILFDGQPYQITIPAGRTGIAGVDDAIEVIDALVAHEGTAQFICIKLVNKFVSDEISLGTYKARTAPEWLLTLVDDAIAAWQSTVPQGNIATVMTSILDPVDQLSGFWLEGANFSKVKTPVEFINSGFRALEADVTSTSLPNRNEGMGMDFFQRNDPDGYSEKGVDWIDTLGLLERMKMSQSLGIDNSFSYSDWDIDTMIANNGITSPEDMNAYFNNLLFNNKLANERLSVFLEFANTDDFGAPSPYATLSSANKVLRLRDLAGLILSAPEFQFQ